jgi:hypothetical protein
MSRWSFALLAACGPAATAPVQAPAEPPLFTIDQTAMGPLNAKTPATLVALRATFAGYDVTPVNTDALEYRVSRGDQRLFEIIPDDAGHVLNVHVVSPAIAVANRTWRVGDAFTDRLDTCECWAEQTVCFNAGEHVAVGLVAVCRNFTLAGRMALAGAPIRTLIWSAKPLVAGGYEVHDSEPRD